MKDFNGENRLVIGDMDAYEESIGDRKPPRLSFDISRGYAVPMIVDVMPEEIEGMRVQQLRREQAVNEAYKAIFGVYPK